MEKNAVISAPGLGDGLLALVMANNLRLNNIEVTLFHPKNLIELQKWVPTIEIQKFPSTYHSILENYEKIFINYHTDSEMVLQLIEEGKKRKKAIVLNPCYSRNIGNQIYYEDCKFIPTLSYAENIELFCKRILKLEKCTKFPPLQPPTQIQKDKNRIVIHPSSTKKGREWSASKYLLLARKLKEVGFSPIFVVSPSEHNRWAWIEKEGQELETFINLDKLASFVAESSYFIGNDSGIGHLASALSLPTLTIGRNRQSLLLWRPSWSKGSFICPSPLIPNLKFLRLRDKYWYFFISVKKVFKRFLNENSLSS